MNSPPTASGTSTRPYLVRALHEWCSDNGFTPYIAVFVDDTVTVPLEYVKNNEIVLNVSLEATTGLNLGNEYIEFKARFGGTPREISVPVGHVIAIYARENGQGMAFPAPTEPAGQRGQGSKDGAVRPGGPLRLAGSGHSTESSAVESSQTAESQETTESPPEGPGPGSRPSLKRVK